METIQNILYFLHFSYLGGFRIVLVTLFLVVRCPIPVSKLQLSVLLHVLRNNEDTFRQKVKLGMNRFSYYDRRFLSFDYHHKMVAIVRDMSCT